MLSTLTRSSTIVICLAAFATSQPNCLTDPTKSCCHASDPKDECTALKNFYVGASKGDGWIYKPNWLLGGTYCSFYGVSCNAEGHVTKLVLPGNGLQGVIDPSIFTKLPFLTEFNVANNQLLAGGIPPEIGRATNLCLFEAYGCSLNGTLPDVFDKLDNFKVTAGCPQPKLDLHYNQLEGALPPSIGGMDGLPYISVANNRFEGPIPKPWENLTQLGTLGIAYNHGINGTLVSIMVYDFMYWHPLMGRMILFLGVMCEHLYQ